MYVPLELAQFALSEFERGLEGLTDEEARTRPRKADGTEMNAISWTAGHLAWHWLVVRWMATDETVPERLQQFATRSTDPTPPSLEEAHELLARARESLAWIAEADEALMVAVHPENRAGENIGTALMRVILHTWFHAGEVNAIRQLLGHEEIRFIGRLRGSLEWRPSEADLVGERERHHEVEAHDDASSVAAAGRDASRWGFGAGFRLAMVVVLAYAVVRGGLALLGA